MKVSRRASGVVVLALLGLAIGVGIVAGQDQRSNIIERMPGRQNNFVRALDTLCACVSDTTMGPSIYCFGARKVIFRIQANAGTCSTFTAQVSNNDSTYEAALSAIGVTVINDFVTGDSLNQGWQLITVAPSDSVTGLAARIASTVIPWRYCRVFVRQRVGYTTTTASAGPTVACRTRADSLRWKAYTVWSNP